MTLNEKILSSNPTQSAYGKIDNEIKRDEVRKELDACNWQGMLKFMGVKQAIIFPPYESNPNPEKNSIIIQDNARITSLEGYLKITIFIPEFIRDYHIRVGEVDEYELACREKWYSNEIVCGCPGKRLHGDELLVEMFPEHAKMFTLRIPGAAVVFDERQLLQVFKEAVKCSDMTRFSDMAEHLERLWRAWPEMKECFEAVWNDNRANIKGKFMIDFFRYSSPMIDWKPYLEKYGIDKLQ